jgi:stage III sporulation protein AB
LRALQKTRDLVLWLAEQIRCTAAPIGELLCACAERSEYSGWPILTQTAAHVRADGEFREAWRTAVCAQQNLLAFSAEERDVMSQAVCLLGTLDVAGELHHCELYGEKLRVCVECRTEELRVRGRLYVALGLCGGCAIALMLL